jgi:hypothetical protein
VHGGFEGQVVGGILNERVAKQSPLARRLCRRLGFRPGGFCIGRLFPLYFHPLSNASPKHRLEELYHPTSSSQKIW